MLLQSDRVTLAGLAVSATGVVGVGQTPAPLPEALTVTEVVDVPSEIVTAPPGKAPDGLVRRIVSRLPFTVAVMVALLARAV